MRRAVAAAVVVALAGCGGGDGAKRTLVDPVGHMLTWREQHGPLTISIRRIAIGAGHWTIVGAVRNTASAPADVGAAGVRVGTSPLREATIFEPALPETLEPRAGWIGAMRGLGALPPRGALHVVVAGVTTRHALALDEPVVLPLHWIENDGPVEIRVQRLVAARDGWTVDLGVRNNGRVTYVVDRPHVPNGARFGLLVTTRPDLPHTDRIPPYIIADEIEPPPPRRLRPGEAWRGRIRGAEELPAGGFVHVVVGRFRTTQTTSGPTHFMAVTDASRHLP